MEIILLRVCDVLSSGFFLLLLFLLLVLPLFAIEGFVGRYQIPFFQELAAELLAETVAMVSFPHQLPFVQIH